MPAGKKERFNSTPDQRSQLKTRGVNGRPEESMEDQRSQWKRKGVVEDRLRMMAWGALRLGHSGCGRAIRVAVGVVDRVYIYGIISYRKQGLGLGSGSGLGLSGCGLPFGIELAESLRVLELAESLRVNIKPVSAPISLAVVSVWIP